jgi:hypothetical protein
MAVLAILILISKPLWGQDAPAYAWLHSDWDYCLDGAGWYDLTRTRSHPPIYEELKRQAAEQMRCAQSQGEEWVEVWPPNLPNYGALGGVVIVFVNDRMALGPNVIYWWIHYNALHWHDEDGEAIPFGSYGG